MVPLTYREVWACDFEFNGADGERPRPVCMVAREARSGKEIRLWRDDLVKLRAAPFATGPNALFIAYFASAELGCFLALGWPPPVNVVDLFAEHRVVTNGKALIYGNSLLGALALRGIASIAGAQKDAMRTLVLRRDTWSNSEAADIVAYCASDTAVTTRLLDRMAPSIDWPRALLRGRYMLAVARMEWVGIPVDVSVLQQLREHWEALKIELIEAVDSRFGVYQGTVFKADLFAAWLIRSGIPWPRHPSGVLKLDSDTFKDQARAHPTVNALHELRSTTARLRLTGSVGGDGRNRCLLSPFASVTGRNQPSNTKFLFGPAVWMRGLIQPPPGYGLAYIDFSAQEIAIAASLSGDARMAEDYATGDPHMGFAKAAGLAPPDATKASHPLIRARCKTTCLGVNYGMEANGLSARLGITPAEGHELLRLHRQTYRRFWQWSEDTVSSAMLSGRMTATFGWQAQVSADRTPRSLMNWPMQSNGAEMLRLACIAATEAGIEVCAPVHDAILIAAPLERLEADVVTVRSQMAMAGAAVTGGLPVRTDAELVRWPDRFMDERGRSMWQQVMSLLANLHRSEHPPASICNTTCIDLSTRSLFL
jgi:DNA polymerase family A